METTIKKLIPVTIISGFLGSGKTTFLNFILNFQHGKKIAIIENEFGEEIGIEKLIAKNGTNGQIFEDFYELSNGCVCCSIKNDLINTLEKLLEKKKNFFDYILVETTGMANPGKIASIFWLDEELESKIYLDGIITIVDAKQILSFLELKDTQNEASSQIAYADRILLNKMDLIATKQERQLIETKLKQLNAMASLQWTYRGKMENLEQILEINSFSINRIEKIESKLQEIFFSTKNNTSKHTNGHTGKVKTTCITFDQPFVLKKLEQFLGQLLWHHQDTEDKKDSTNIFRVKGIIEIQNEPFKYILQGVGELFEIRPSEEKWNKNEQLIKCESKIIFIGIDIDYQLLKKQLAYCLLS
jgi:G3E family GTPase